MNDKDMVLHNKVIGLSYISFQMVFQALHQPISHQLLTF